MIILVSGQNDDHCLIGLKKVLSKVQELEATIQNFSLGNGKSKIPFSLGIPMMGIPRAETLLNWTERCLVQSTRIRGYNPKYFA